jgi:hypothetical protein
MSKRKRDKMKAKERRHLTKETTVSAEPKPERLPGPSAAKRHAKPSAAGIHTPALHSALINCSEEWKELYAAIQREVRM